MCTEVRCSVEKALWWHLRLHAVERVLISHQPAATSGLILTGAKVRTGALSSIRWQRNDSVLKVPQNTKTNTGVWTKGNWRLVTQSLHGLVQRPCILFSLEVGASVYGSCTGLWRYMGIEGYMTWWEAHLSNTICCTNTHMVVPQKLLIKTTVERNDVRLQMSKAVWDMIR